ncbi:MAG: SAM-dependent chlorinase/fluorinase [Rhodospirillaceae bacterium]|nr:SAM-dependent chlorinase/fluorinase [Rhodospirillaceae bacterium]
MASPIAPSVESLPQILFFCDFGLPYTGQMRSRVLDALPLKLRGQAQIIDLMLDVPAHDVRYASVLLAALADGISLRSVFVCVVDPGVGSDRPAGAVFAGGRWFVGPLGGLFEHILRRWPDDAEVYSFEHDRGDLSASFHGRDLFAPLAARIAIQGKNVEGLKSLPIDAHRCPDWSDDVAQVIYVDGFGNAITGVRATQKWAESNPIVCLGDTEIKSARTFSDVPEGTVMAYENAFGLIEIAVNRGSAAKQLGLVVGSHIRIK